MNGVGRERRTEERNRHNDAAAREIITHSLQRAVNAFLRRVIAQAERFAHFAQTFSGEEPEQHGILIGLPELAHCFLKQRRDFLPGAFTIAIEFGELHSEVFPFTATPVTAARRLCGELSGAIKPTREYGSLSQRTGLARETDEDQLRDIFGQLALSQEPQRRRVHEVDVTLNELGESPLGPVLGVFAQKLNIFHNFLPIIAARNGNPTRIF